jgi:hypothetical protein
VSGTRAREGLFCKSQLEKIEPSRDTGHTRGYNMYFLPTAVSSKFFKVIEVVIDVDQNMDSLGNRSSVDLGRGGGVGDRVVFNLPTYVACQIVCVLHVATRKD